MPDIQSILAITIVAAPVAFLVFVGVRSLVDWPAAESTTSYLVEAAILVSMLAALSMGGLMIASGDYHVTITLGDWIVIPHYHFTFRLLFDPLSLPFVLLTLLLCGTISAFATKYLHREPGYNRFFVLFGVFVVGMLTAALAGTIETLFAGWELVGLSSALLVAFFHERATPVRNGLRVWAVYRVADAALLIAAIYLHHMRGLGDFDRLFGAAPWPAGEVAFTSTQAFILGFLFLVAAAGKSALVPFSGWLPRAMEGPTPSSAIFYGALSVHLGVFLLLRVGPILSASPALGVVIVALGLTTALFASLTGRVQTDIKTALSYASLTQVGIIVAEIGCGLRWIPLLHILGHACLRTLQFLRTPSLLQDYRRLENAIGSQLPHLSANWTKRLPASVRVWFYRLALERGYLDACLNDWVVQPVLTLFRWCDSMERRWTDYLSGGQSRESDRVPAATVGDELA